MFAFLAPIAHLLATRRPAGAAATGVARRLLESAEARAGSDAHHAQELRGAAYAYLRVIR
jgi:hypothetical protein